MATKLEAWAKNSKIFEIVIFIVVSQKFNVKTVQQEIAEGLGLKLEENSLHTRAEKIHARLRNEKSFLIILDDVWERLDLAKLGIPSKSITERRKLILTSRSHDALINLTNDYYKIFIVDILSYQEAWKLFREKVGDSIEAPELKKIAKQVAKKCKGLPLALVVVGSALRNKSKSMWEDALVQLKRSHIPSYIPRVLDDLYVPLRWSYEQLPSEQVKHVFLLCCLFPEDYEIPTETLVRHGWGLNAFNNIETMEEARDRVSFLVDILKSRFLLNQGKIQPFFGTGESVRVHDIVREMGIFIASEGRYVFMVSQGNWTRISSYDNISHIYVELNGKPDLPETLNCPRLKFLHIQLYADFDGEIPEEFFSSNKGLKVLSLCNFERKKLPSSISKLINLLAIHLEDCSLGTLESVFRNMLNLEIISLRGSSLDVLPREIGELKELKVLDLTRCKIISTKSGVISKLVKLEELLMLTSEFWEEEEEDTMMVVEEICSLSRYLVNLQINLLNQKILSIDTPFLPKLERFVLQVVEHGRYFDVEIYDDCALYNKVAFFDCNEAVPMSNFILSMIRNVECLRMLGDCCIGILSELANTKFQGIKYLSSAFDRNVEYLVLPIVASQSQSVLGKKDALFSTVESLSLEGCQNLKEICPHQLCVGSFSSLKNLHLHNMKIMKRALPVSKFQVCSHLEVIKISNCPLMEDVFWEQQEQGGVQITTTRHNKIKFHRLHRVMFDGILELEVLFKGIEEIEFPALKRLTINNLPKMTNFASTTNYNINGDQFFFNKKIIFSNLNVLVLREVNINGIFDYNIDGSCFNQLEFLLIESCNNLKNVMVHSLSRNFKNLKTLYIICCKELEKVIIPDNNENREEEEEEGQRNNTKEKLFPQLRNMLLSNLPKMYTVCHISSHIELPSSLEVTIQNCPLLKTFSSGSLSCPDIKVLGIQDPALVTKIFQTSPGLGDICDN